MSSRVASRSHDLRSETVGSVLGPIPVGLSAFSKEDLRSETVSSVLGEGGAFGITVI